MRLADLRYLKRVVLPVNMKRWYQRDMGRQIILKHIVKEKKQ